jgi:hypothetical protein
MDRKGREKHRQEIISYEKEKTTGKWLIVMNEETLDSIR